MFGAVTQIEAAGRGVVWLDINADLQSVLRDEPFRQKAKQLRGNRFAATLWNHIDPLQFAIAGKAASEMSGSETDKRIAFLRDVADARSQRLPRMMFVIQVTGNGDAPNVLDAPFGGANARHRGDICLFGQSEE